MNVCVIGGGAAGMLAALTAAENGHRVLLLERQSRVGRKPLATGNGRRNLSNYHVSPRTTMAGPASAILPCRSLMWAKRCSILPPWAF